MTIGDAYKAIQSFAERQTQDGGHLRHLPPSFRFENDSDKVQLREALVSLMRQCPYKLKKENWPFYNTSKTEIFIQRGVVEQTIWGRGVTVGYSDYFHEPRIEVVEISISDLEFPNMQAFHKARYKNTGALV